VRGRAKIVAVTVDADNDDLDEIIAPRCGRTSCSFMARRAPSGC